MQASRTPLGFLPHLAYLLFSAISVFAWIASLPQWMDLFGSESLARGAEALHLSFMPVGIVLVGAGLLASGFWLGIGALLVWRRSHDFFGLVLALTAVLTAVSIGPLSVPGEIRFVGGPVGYALAYLANFFSVLGLYLFPSGRFVPEWTRYAGLAFFIWNAFGFWLAMARGPDQDVTPILLGSLVFLLSGTVAQVYRYARVSGSIERQQTKWVTYGIGVVVAVWALRSLLPLLDAELRSPETPAGFVYTGVAAVVYDASVLLLGITVAVAMLRRRLLGIDLIINRTLVYGIVTVFLAIAFALLSAGSQRLAAIAGFPSELATIIVAAVVAAAFLPVRQRVRSFVDRYLPPRAQLALLFTDIVGSTEVAARLGDTQWREALQRYRVEVRRLLRRFGGHEVDTAGDSFFATFERPSQAVRCAIDLRGRTRALGFPSRTAVHWGECEVRGEKASGMNVHVAARLLTLAGADEVVISEAVRSEITTDGIDMADRGSHVLRGVPGEWLVYALR